MEFCPKVKFGLFLVGDAGSKEESNDSEDGEFILYIKYK